MSFRELRNFVEMMKALGYQRLISIENFRRPNFELVADVLFWLVHRYEPGCDITSDISTQDKRVEFLKAVATLMSTKARIKLNIKQLYRADGYAVKEVLRICSLLYDAMNAHNLPEDPAGTVPDVQIGTKLEELKTARTLASEIVDSGAKLYTLLGKEEELKQSRSKALAFLDAISMNLDSNDPHEHIERNIREQINIISGNIEDLESLCKDLEKDQKSLKSKIERKRQDVERTEKRYKSLKKVRPAFMEEYDHLEGELRQVYDMYLERYRNLSYLESELHKYHQAELEKKADSDRALKRMQKRLREEELCILRGEQGVDEEHLDDHVFDSGKEDSDSEPRARTSMKAKRPERAQGGRAKAAVVVA